MCMVGSTDSSKDHPWYGLFCCRKCHRKVDKRELTILQTRHDEMINNKNNDDDDNNTLSSKQIQRLRILQERKTNHPLETKRSRDKDIAKRGAATVLQEEREYELERNRKRSAEVLNADQATLEQKRKKSRAQEENRLASGGKKKVGGTNRRNKNKTKRYDRYFFKMLQELFEILMEQCGDTKLYWNYVVELFDLVLVREKDNIRNVTVTFVDDNKGGQVIEYLDEEYKRICQPYTNRQRSFVVIKKKFLPSEDEMKVATKARSVLEAQTNKNGYKIFLAHLVEVLYERRRNRAQDKVNEEANEMNEPNEKK